MAFPAPPAQSQNSTVPLRNLMGWLDLSSFPAGFEIPRPEGAKARGSCLDKGNPCVNRSYILFLVLASFVFAMLSSGRIANFVMRSNHSVDVCPERTPRKPSRRLLVVADRNSALKLSNVVASGHFVRGTAHLARRLSVFRLPLFFHSRRSARTSVDRLPRRYVLSRPAEAERARIL